MTAFRRFQAWASPALLLAALATAPVSAQTQTWDGGAGGTGTELGTAANWTNDALPAVTGGTAVWNGTVAGNLALVYTTTSLAGSAGNAGLNLSLTSGQTGNLLIDGSSASPGIRLADITVAGGAGALTLGGGTVAGTFTLTLGAGNANDNAFTWTNNSSNAVTLNSDVQFVAGGGADKTITFTGSGSWLVNNNISPSGKSTAVIKSGAGALTIAAANTSTTGVTVNSGTLNVNNAGALGTGTFTLSGGVIDNTSAAAITNSNNNVQAWNGDFAFTGTRDLDLGTGAVTLGSSRTVTVTGGSLTVGGSISGLGFALTKAGVGTLVLTGSNSYSGGTNLNGGVVSLGSAGALASTGTIAFGGGTMRYGSANQTDYSGRIKNSGGAIAIDTNSQSIAFTSALDSTNTGGLTKSGSGTLSLSGVNTYTGTTTVSAGVLAISDTTALPGWNTAGRLVVSTGAALYVGNAVTDPSVTTLLTTGSNFRAGAAIGFDTSAGNRTLAASVADTAQGSLGLVKVGANSLTLSAANTYTGTTTVSAGSLVLSHSNAVVNSTLALGAGGVVFDSAVSGRTYNLGGLAATTGTVNLVNNAGSPQSVTLNVGGNNASTTFNGVLTGTTGGALVKTGTGTLTLGGANSYNGNTTVSAGTLLLASGAQLYATTASGSVTIGSGATLSFTGNFGWAATFGFLNPAATGLTIDGGTLQHYGTSNTNTQSSGRLLTIGSQGATLDSVTAGQVFSVGYRSDFGSSLTSSSGGSLTLTGAGDGDLNLGLPGTGGLIKNGSGTWKLTGTTSSYSGGTQLNAGTLQLGSTNALGSSSGSLAVNGGSLNLAGNSVTVGALSGSSGATITTSTGSAVLTASGNTNSTYAGVIRDALGLVKSGSGTLSLTGVNTYSGATSVTDGRLQVDSTGSVNASSGITINGATADFRYNAATALTAPITFTAGTLSGTGTIGTAVTAGTGDILSPGNSPGIQSFTQGLTFAPGGQYTWEINNWTGAAGTAYDQLAVSGSALNITATSGSTFKILLTSLTGSNTAGAVPGFSPGTTGTTFTIATSSAGITGFDASRFSIDSSTAFGNVNTLPAGAGFWLTTNAGSTSLILNYAPSATYTLSAAASATAIRVGGTSTITATITSSTASLTNPDTMTYGGLALSGGLGTLSASGTLAPGVAATGSAAFTPVSSGSYAFTPSVSSATNVNLGTAANAGSSTGASVLVYNPAVATTSGSVNLGTVIVGATSSWTKSLSITNSAPTGRYSESLNASFGTLSGVTTNSGSFSLLAAGSTNASAMIVALPTGSVGNLVGSAQITFQTDGQGTSGLAAESLAPQTVNVYGTVLDHATSSLAGSLLTSTTISLGEWSYATNSWQSGGGTALFDIHNLASSFGAQLTADLALLGVGGTANGFSTNLNAYTDIAGGSSRQFSILTDTSGWTTSGLRTTTFTIAMGDKVGLTGASSSNTLSVTAQVIVVPEPTALAIAGIGIAAALSVRRCRRRRQVTGDVATGLQACRMDRAGALSLRASVDRAGALSLRGNLEPARHQGESAAHAHGLFQSPQAAR